MRMVETIIADSVRTELRLSALTCARMKVKCVGNVNGVKCKALRSIVLVYAMTRSCLDICAENQMSSQIMPQTTESASSSDAPTAQDTTRHP